MSSYRKSILIPTIIVVVMVGFFSPQLPAQVPESESRLLDTLEKVDSLISLREYEMAKELSHKVKNEAKEQSEWNSFYKAIYRLTSIARRQQDNLAFADSLIKYVQLLPDSLILKKAKLTFNSGVLLARAGRIPAATSYYQKAIPDFREQKDTFMYLSAINNLCNAYARIGDYQSAHKIIDEGIGFLEHDQDHKYYGRFISNKGGYHLSSGDPSSSIPLFEEAINLGYDSTRVKISLIRAFTQLADFRTAETCIADLKDVTGWYKEKYLSNCSDYYLTIKNYKEAIKTQVKYIDILVKDGSSERELTKQYATLANIYFQSEEYDKSIIQAHNAFANHYEQVNSADIYSHPPEAIDPDIYVVEASYIKAKCHNHFYKATQQEKDLEATRFYYDFMFKIFDELKSNIKTNLSNYRIGSYSQSMYADAINFYLESYKESNNREDYEKAFTIAQLANAYVLRNTISSRKALELNDVSADTINRFLELESELSAAYNKDQSKILDSLILPFNKLKEAIEEKHPGYKTFVSEEITSLEKIQSALSDNEILIKYFFHDSILTVFTIANSRVGSELINLNQSDLADIDLFNQLILKSSSNYTADDETQFAIISKSIYDKILKPIEDNKEFADIDHLYIIPDGPIKGISFNALMHRESTSWTDFKDFLVDKYSISYLYYAGQLKQATTSGSKDGFVGFGIKYEDVFLKQVMQEYFDTDSIFTDGSRSASLSVLNNAIDEVMSCAELLGGKSILEKSVTRSSILSNLSKAQIVHFAVHALVDKDNFMNSYILLNKDENNTFDLTYKDVLNLKTDSDLVVLSACQTGIGQNIQGEGLMSMARAFVQGGSKASMGSYWNAPDKATMQLMKIFYSNLKDGMTKSEALKAAQIEYMSNDDISSPSVRAPYYWAGWTIYGDNDPINLSEKLGSKWILLCGGIVLFLLLALIYNRKRVAA